MGGDIYRARAGYSRTAVASDAGLAVGNVDLEGVLDDAGLEADALRAGLYDGAEVRFFVVNWQDPSQGVLRLRRGWLGEVTLLSEGQWRTELRGQRLLKVDGGNAPQVEHWQQRIEAPRAPRPSRQDCRGEPDLFSYAPAARSRTFGRRTSSALIPVWMDRSGP